MTEDSSLLQCDTLQIGIQVQMFPTSMLSPSLGLFKKVLTGNGYMQLSPFVHFVYQNVIIYVLSTHIILCQQTFKLASLVMSQYSKFKCSKGLISEPVQKLHLESCELLLGDDAGKQWKYLPSIQLVSNTRSVTVTAQPAPKTYFSTIMW